MGKGAHPRNPPSHVEILRRGPAAWNRWRDNNQSTIPDLNGLGLRPGEREMGPNHGGPINLNSALLQEASLRSACLSAADLERADLSGADLCHGRLNQANLGAADLRDARLDHADLTGAILNEAKLHGARLRSVNLTDADLKGADLSAADLLHARLRGANLAAANFGHARLDHADLAGAKLKDANLAGASLYHAKNLTSAQLEEAKGDESTILSPHLAGTVSWSSARNRLGSTRSKARPKKAAMRAAPPPAAPARTARYSLLRLFNGRAPWIAAAALWTFVVIGVAMKQNSEAVPLLPPVISTMPELSLASAAGPVLTTAKRAFTHETPGDPARDAETASSRPIVFAALGEPRQAARPAPSVLDEPQDKSPPVDMGVRTTPLRLLMPDLAIEDIRPDTVPAVEEKAPKARLASLKQTSLRPVNQVVTIRLREAPADTPLAEEPSDAPMTLVVSLRHQKLDVYRGTRLIETTEISSGMADHETKAGVFSILEKRRYHHSNMYSNAPMPWMQRLTRSGTALHGGDVPGYPASHGCIRLPLSFATKLFHMTERGMNVVVTDDQIAPVRIDHPNLPQPVSAFADISPPQASLEAGNDSVVTDARSAPPLRILVTRRTLRDRLISLQYTLAEMGYLARQNFTGIIGRQTRAAISSFQRANNRPETGALTKDLAAAIYQAAGKEEPPAGHLFVRQGHRRLFDAPIAFNDPDRSLGTHVLTRMNRSPGEGEIAWLAMSLEGGDAASALDRLQIPDELRQKLAAVLTPGSTFIIGDISLDTAILPEGDDFIVLTKDVPVVAETPQDSTQAARKTVAPKQVKRHTRRATREARRVFDPGSRNFPRGLFSRW